VPEGAALARSRRVLAAAAVTLLAGCGDIESSSLPLREDFTDCDGFTMNDEASTVDCPGGELRILVSQPGISPMHFVPLRFDARPEALEVSADVRAPVPGQVWGIGCLASAPGQPGRGYALLVAREEGVSAILRISAPAGEGIEGRFPQELEVLREGTVPIPDPSGDHLLRIRCARQAGGAVRVRGAIDSGKPLIATDGDGIGPYEAAFAIVLTDRSDTDVRFDNVTANE
jgi:hypothetical protein